MKRISCDVAIIGAGSAGLAARKAAAATRAKVILIESGPGGTTCARVGCMPSKLLLAAAKSARDVADAPAFGVGRQGRVRIDGRAVMARVQRERDRFVADVLRDVAQIPAAQKIHGHARFAGPTTLAIDDHTLVEARAIVIASGGRPFVPKTLADVCGERLVTHETVFDLNDLPASLGVIGGGPLGLELATAFARLGVATTLFDEGHAIGGAHDPEIQVKLQQAARGEMTLNLGVSIEAARAASGNIVLSWKQGARKKRATFAYILDAAGRPPTLDDLDLNLAGLELDGHGVPVFDPATMRCGDSAVFIAGDANNFRPVLHEAALQGELAGRNAAHFPKLEQSPPGVNVAITFTDPDIAAVGEGFDAEKARRWAIGASDSNGRAHVQNRDAGLLRAYARREDHVLIGGELFGPDVEHLAHLLAWAVQLEMKVEDVLALPFYHPTMEESLRACLRDLRDNLG